MKPGWGIKYFAYTEIILGLVSLFSLALCLFRNQLFYPAPIIVFLFTTALISTSLGIGMLNYNLHAYYLLIFFSGVIILSKILIFSNIITLNQTIASTLIPEIKNTISLIYHGLLILYFTRKPVLDIFLGACKKNVEP